VTNKEAIEIEDDDEDEDLPIEIGDDEDEVEFVHERKKWPKYPHNQIGCVCCVLLRLLCCVGCVIVVLLCELCIC
jgi:hypothetical protein